MINSMKSLISVVLLSSGLFAQLEAYEALKVFEPFIGEWFSKHNSVGAFEGLPKNKQIESATKYEWITDKTAVMETWRSTFPNSDKRVNVGSIIYSLDPSTNTIKSKHFGYDGKVYWSGKGWVETKDSTIYVYTEELTINGTVTKYTTIRRPAENNNLESQYIDFIQNGKPLKDQPLRKMRRIDVAPKKD